MKKEDILKASRKENKNKDFAVIEVENKAVKIAALGMLILASIYFCLEIIVQGKENYGLYSIIALYCAIVYGYKGIKTKNKFEIICMIIWTVVAIPLIITYIKGIFTGAI